MKPDELHQSLELARELKNATMVLDFQTKLIPSVTDDGIAVLGIAVKENDEDDAVIFIMQSEQVKILAEQMLAAVDGLEKLIGSGETIQ